MTMLVARLKERLQGIAAVSCVWLLAVCGCTVRFGDSSGPCGNGVMEPAEGEECDWRDFGGVTCVEAAGRQQGELRCTATCRLDVSQCHTCDDGVIEGPEECEGSLTGGETCQTLGYASGDLGCGADCLFDTSGCHTCGNGEVEGPEECDGPDFGGRTCRTLGHTGGTLGCTQQCAMDAHGCYDCGNSACEPASGETVGECAEDCGWISLSAGIFHTCGIKRDGSAWCWGWNEFGQIGDGTTTDRVRPVQVTGLSGVLRISAGYRHTCSVAANDTVWCWGGNDTGQLGNGTTQGSPVPIQVEALGGVNSISANGFHVSETDLGGDHTCAVDSSRQVWCWGWNLYGQLGDGSFMDRHSPTQISHSGSFLSVHAGVWHTCALGQNRSVWCWGQNSVGQLGDPASHQSCAGGTMDCSPSPVLVAGAGEVEQLTANALHGCVTRQDGGAWCWGANDSGQLGDSTTTTSATPVQVVGLPQGVTSLSAGAMFNCSLVSANRIYCWGQNEYGQLGDGQVHTACGVDAFDCSPTPVQLGDLFSATAVSAGAHGCAIDQNYQAWCWGLNNKGQLGIGSSADPFTCPDVEISCSGTPVLVLEPF